ncbi:MAG: hypothetical protein ACFFCD_09215 [Promethearchaeota archaeon]
MARKEEIQINPYKIYYLNENPFPILPSGLSNVFVLTMAQKGAMAALKDLAINVSLHGKPGALALHGEFGVGKTTLLMKFNQVLCEGKLKFNAEGFPAEVKGIGLRHVFKGSFTDQLTQILQNLPQIVETADKEKTERIIKEVANSGYISNINSELLRKIMTLNLVGKSLVDRLNYNLIHLAFDEVEQELLVIGLENREARLHDFRQFLDNIGRIWEQGVEIYQIPFMITLSVSPQAWQYAVSRFQRALPDRFLYHVEVPPLISVEDTKQMTYAYLSSARTCELEGCYPFSDDAIQFIHESLKGNARRILKACQVLLYKGALEGIQEITEGVAKRQFLRSGIKFEEVPKKKKHPTLTTIELQKDESLVTDKPEISSAEVISSFKDFFQLIFGSVNIGKVSNLDENKTVFSLELSTKEVPSIVSKALVFINLSKESINSTMIETRYSMIKPVDMLTEKKLDFIFIFSRGPVLSDRLTKTYREVPISRLMLIRELDDQAFLDIIKLNSKNLTSDAKKEIINELEDRLKIGTSFSKMIADLKAIGLILPNLWIGKKMGQETGKLAAHFLTNLFELDDAKAITVDKKECKQWVEKLVQMGLLENITTKYRFKASTVWEERLYNLLAESEGALGISELSRNFFCIPSRSTNVAYMLQLMEGKGAIIRDTQIPRPYYNVVQPEVKKTTLLERIERVKKDIPRQLLNLFQDKLLKLRTTLEQQNYTPVLERLIYYKTLENELTSIEQSVKDLSEKRNVLMDSIIKEIEEINEIEEEYVSKITLNDPLKEKILSSIDEISKNLDLASDYATLFAIQKAEKYYDSAIKQFEMLKEDEEFIEGFKKIKKKITIQKDAKEIIAAIKRSIEYIKKFIEDSPTLSHTLELEAQLDAHESLYSELEDALTTEDYEQIMEKGKTASSKEAIDESAILFLKEFYKKAQQTTTYVQEILNDFDILQFATSKEYSSEIDKNLLKGTALINAHQFEQAFIAFCECLNLNKTALNTVVLSTENLLKELNCNDIQSTIEIFISKYKFPRESILKLIFRLVLLQRLEIDGKFVWTKEKGSLAIILPTE